MIYKIGQVFRRTDDPAFDYEFELKGCLGNYPVTMLSGELVKKTKTNVEVSRGAAIMEHDELDEWQLFKTY